MTIFRKNALDKLASPDRLDALLYIVSSRLWLALLFAALLVSLGLLWSIVANLPVTLNGVGFLARADNPILVNADEVGIIQSVLANVGNEVNAEQALVVLTTGNEIKAPVAGRILTINVQSGDRVNTNSVLVSMEATDDTTNPLQAILFVEAIDGQKVQPGMPVELYPSTVRVSESGFLVGQVASVTTAPVLPARISQVFGSNELANSISNGANYVEVHVELLPDSTAPSGYRWSAAGASTKLYSGTATTGTIVIGQQHPINLILAGR